MSDVEVVRNVDLAQSLGRVEGKVDLLVAGMTQHFADDKKTFEELHKKVDGLKTKWAYAAGATAVVTFLVTNSGVFQSILSILPK